MHGMASRLARVLWCVCACALLFAPRATAGERAFAGDFDGDGRGDHVTFNGADPTVLRVWLSATGTTDVIRSSEPLLYVAAADLDGDHRAELIATQRSRGFQVWTKKARGFHAFRPIRAVAPLGIGHSGRGVFDDEPPFEAGSTDSPTPLAASAVVSARLDAPIAGSLIESPSLARGPTASPCLNPLAPRPPPLSSI